jgi:DNA-binding protein YbaB
MYQNASDLYDEAFKMVDMDIAFNDDDAGYVAEMVEEAFKDAVNNIERGG